MNTSQNFGGDFVGLEKVVEIGASVVFAAFAVTIVFERGEIVSEFGVFDIDATVFSIK